MPRRASRKDRPECHFQGRGGTCRAAAHTYGPAYPPPVALFAVRKDTLGRSALVSLRNEAAGGACCLAKTGGTLVTRAQRNGIPVLGDAIIPGGRGKGGHLSW